MVEKIATKIAKKLMTGAFLITLNQLEKTGSTGKVRAISTFVFGVLFKSFSSDEFQLNSKNAYINLSAFINASIFTNNPWKLDY